MAGKRSSLRGFRPHIRMHNASKEFTYENRFNYCTFLLGLLFSVFGPNGFLHFIHQPPPSDPLALKFLVAVSASQFAAFFFAVQVVGAAAALRLPCSDCVDSARG
jgi:hypothetical protein